MRIRHLAFFMGLSLLLPAAISAEATQNASRVAIVGFVNATGSDRYDAAAKTATDSLLLTLTGLNAYQIVRAENGDANGAGDLVALCDTGRCDYAIYGSIRAGKEGTLDCALSVFRRSDETTPVTRTEKSVSLLGIFNATDDLIATVLESVTGSHIGFGSITLERSGAGDYLVELDGIPMGENAVALPRVVAGAHRIIIRQRSGDEERVAFDGTTTVTEGGDARIAFALPGIDETQDLIAPPEEPGTVVYIPYPVQISIDGDVSDWATVPAQKVSTGPSKSPNSQQTPYFDFSVAADETHLYFRMHVVDSKIIAKKHGKDFWNEDSLEFFFNLSGDLTAKKYRRGIAQITITPGDIGKNPGSNLTISGIGSEAVKVTGAVFTTADGWGFEAAVPLDSVRPEQGLAIGVQAQANGATRSDRDCKLIWSKADKNDQSFANPSLFGKGIFFKVGSADVPAAQ
ncbi:MAG TPA: sugar-binding protein [Treponemataceae bacterium]|nr:sugar-binding protein [Treponemataceae bacterium]